MLIFVIRRVLMGLALLLVSSFLMYMLVDFTIDPLEDLRTSTDPSAALQMEQRTEQLNLNAPPWERYFDWLGAFVTGDPGVSWNTGRSVSDLLGSAIISTLQLVSFATVAAIVLGVAVGIVSALRQYSSFDYLITFFAFLMFSLPSFWVAVLLKQWGAIGFNDFLVDPVIAPMLIAGISLAAGVFWQLAVGGTLRRRLIHGALAALAVALVLGYMQITDWWLQPRLDWVLLTVTSLGIALTVTTLSTGLRNRRSLYTALSCVALGLVLYFPVRYYLFSNSMLTPYMNYGIVLLLGLAAILVGALVGVAWRGPDWKQSARTGAISAFLIAGVIFLDKVMSYWPAYMAAPAINNRPIQTIGDRAPNLGGNFWVQLLDQYTHLILPTLALMLISFAGYTRFSRGSMLEVMNQDYIRTARAKGINERTVVMRHGFRNSLIPLASIIPVDIIGLIGGALITERIFSRPGMGQLFIANLNMNDIDPVMAYLVIVAFLAILANIVADLLYAALDPRIRVNA
ncbi:ABC transporter permease [Pseudactinotalea suaedae]|jgi:peptide/nickel transport system permease protein|uniref:ABC transporter permease n=1 Tax=Pseudactinotalea suaedae TaxID=1524924 RepID=UPI0012E2BE05|nr:ABC transporter permease [Pseudactinotalea suaedae]